ncbi:hypothetical protein SAMN04487996_112182 [Dyadobacter soli]|uniref:Uncharacterized protein n=1 Tax=Dyadobacter soli TaxID=659014 RepID=A0A1G7NYI4_9BACT|nr:hypothetical protein [Dyadobacter soli]SDF78260.1 hypothetical protein SAMN04487996_112182 [Dyadobacter soli]
MEQVIPTEAGETKQALPITDSPEAAKTTTPEQRPGLVLDNIAARMMQTRRDIDAYNRGEMTKAELEALGIKLF